MTKHRLDRLAVLLTLPLLLTSCIDFDGQTLSFHYDRPNDELRIFQVYERIYADTGKDGKLTNRELEQLASLTDNQTTFFFDNWLLVYSDKTSRNRVAEIEKQLATGDAAQVPQLKAELDVHKALLASVHVTNGQFFLNDEKELCAYQTVTVSNVSRLIELANRAINLDAHSGKLGDFDKESQKQIRDFAEDGKWVQLDGNRLSIRFLQSRKQFAEGAKSRAKYTANGKPVLANRVHY
ncbi:MAG: hypothetical protein KDA84_07205, partial [Planctomycetaceae bacterium]|nr:hypothetical protein [Planctomycetaceae bacterium]